MKQEQPKYLITTTASGVIFLNSNTGKKPTVVLDNTKALPFTEEDKIDYSDDLQVYGPKIVLQGYNEAHVTKPVKTSVAKTSGSPSKKVSKKVQTKKTTEAKASVKTKAQVNEETKKEIEAKLANAPALSKEETMTKVRKLKKQYVAEEDKTARKAIKKEIETLLENITE